MAGGAGGGGGRECDGDGRGQGAVEDGGGQGADRDGEEQTLWSEPGGDIPRVRIQVHTETDKPREVLKLRGEMVDLKKSIFRI